MKVYNILMWIKRHLTNISLPQRKMIGDFVYGLLNVGKIGVQLLERNEE